MKSNIEIFSKIAELKQQHQTYKSISDSYLNDYLCEISTNGANSGQDLKKKLEYMDTEMRKVEEHLKILNWVVK